MTDPLKELAECIETLSYQAHLVTPSCMALRDVCQSIIRIQAHFQPIADENVALRVASSSGLCSEHQEPQPLTCDTCNKVKWLTAANDERMREAIALATQLTAANAEIARLNERDWTGLLIDRLNELVRENRKYFPEECHDGASASRLIQEIHGEFNSQNHQSEVLLSAKHAEIAELKAKLDQACEMVGVYKLDKDSLRTQLAEAQKDTVNAELVSYRDRTRLLNQLEHCAIALERACNLVDDSEQKTAAQVARNVLKDFAARQSQPTKEA